MADQKPGKDNDTTHVNQLFEGGIPGLILFLFPLSILFIFLIRKFKSTQGERQNLVLTVILGLVAISTTNQFNTSGTNPLIRSLLIPYLALAYSLIREDLPSWSVFPKRKWVLSASTFGLLAILFLSGYGAIGSSISSYLLKQGYQELREKGYTKKHIPAQVLSPGSFDTLFWSGVIEKRMKNDSKAVTLLHKAHEKFPYASKTGPSLKTFLGLGIPTILFGGLLWVFLLEYLAHFRKRKNV